MKITQTKAHLQKSNTKYLIELSGTEIDMFFDALNSTQRKILLKSLRKAIGDVLGGSKRIKEIKKELKKLDKKVKK